MNRRATWGVILVVMVIGLTIVGLTHRKPSPESPSADASAISHSDGGPSRPSRPSLPPPSGERDSMVPTAVIPSDTVITNAADLYRQAFAELEALTDEERALIANWKQEVDATELCEKLAPIVARAVEATAITNCDWGIELEGRLDSSTVMPTRQLARVLIWDAAHCHNGDSLAIANIIQASLQLGDNISLPPVGHLVNSALQSMTIEFLTTQGSKLSTADTEQIVARLTDGSYEALFFKAMEEDIALNNAAIERMQQDTYENIDKPVELYGFEGLNKLLNEELVDIEELKKLTKGEFIDGVRRSTEIQSELLNIIGRTDSEYQAWIERVTALQKENAVVKFIWSAVEGTLERTRYQIVTRAMAAAGLTVLQSGKDALAQYPDPATGRPFIYRATTTGFTLESAFRYREQPVSLTFVR